MNKGKSKVIIYGLGKGYEQSKVFLEETFDIIAYSDKNWERFQLEGAVAPIKIKEYSYDYVYITSLKYSSEIEQELCGIYRIDKEKILTLNDMWWNIKNASMRNEWIIQKIKEIPAGSRILDAGAGNMPYKKYCQHLSYVSQDFGEYDDSACDVGLQNSEWHSKRVNIISDIVDIPVKDNSFDIILCSEVLEHIKNPNKVLEEFARIIKKDGILLLTAPFCSITHMAPYYYTNGFSEYWYKDNLQEQGFKILEAKPYGNWFEYVAQELIRFPYVAQRYGKIVNDYGANLITQTVKYLLEQSKEDRGSNELLCFGYMVKAVKM